MLAERPRHPNSRRLERATRNGLTIYFLPDEISQFGVWTNYPEADDALKIWIRQFQGKPQPQWRSYCQARGWSSVSWK